MHFAWLYLKESKKKQEWECIGFAGILCIPDNLDELWSYRNATLLERHIKNLRPGFTSFFDYLDNCVRVPCYFVRIRKKTQWLATYTI